MLSTSGGGGGGGGWCSVHQGDTKSTSGGYQEYIGGIPRVHRGDIMSTLGDVQYIGGYHDACGGIS